MADIADVFLMVVGKEESETFLERVAGQRAQYPNRPDTKEKVAFTFNSLFPVPEDIVQKGAHYGFPWQSEHWGTVTDPEDFVIAPDGEMVIISFQTKWTPPKGWFNHVCQLFPNFEMRLFYMMEYERTVGVIENDNGTAIQNEYFEDTNPSEYEKMVYMYF